MKIRGATAPKCQENLIDALNAACASHTHTHSCISTTQSRSGQPEETVPHGDSLRLTNLLTKTLFITASSHLMLRCVTSLQLQLHFHLQSAIFLEEVNEDCLIPKTPYPS